MRTSFCIALLVVAATQQSAPSSVLFRQLAPSVASCRHDAHASDIDRTRRAEALTLARAINNAEAESVRRTKQYLPVTGLGSLPPVPHGFVLKLFADRNDYVFAVKDTLDPCRYAIFSDSAGLLYEKSARTAPVIAQ